MTAYEFNMTLIGAVLGIVTFWSAVLLYETIKQHRFDCKWREK